MAKVRDGVVAREGLFVHRTFFDKHLRHRILSASEQGYDSAGAVFRGTETIVDEGYRRCRVVGVSPEVEAEIAGRFDAIAPVLESHFRVPVKGFQQPRLLLYRKGDFFVPHQDADANGPSWLSDRKLTAVVFVNGQEGRRARGDYRGGTLTLYRLSEGAESEDVRTRVQGEPGTLVAFRASLFHEVSRITLGERYSVVTWYY